MCVDRYRFLKTVLVIISIFITAAISKAEIRGYYKFTSKNNLGLDSSGCSNNAIWGDTAYTTGYTGYAFLGTGQTYLEFEPLFSNSVDTYTITAWIKKNYAAVDTYEYIYYDPYYQVGLHYQKDSSEINYSWGSQGSPSNWRSHLVVPTSNKWVFVAMVVELSKATVYLYKDGQMSSAIHNYTHQAKSCYYSYIAGQYWYDPDYEQTLGFFRGAIDDLRIYNHALTSNEISSLVAGINSPPRVDAGEDMDIVTSSITLNGLVMDDGLPNPPGTITKSWSKISGPGTMTFSPDVNVLNPTIELSEYGSYVLKLTASDSQYEANDIVTINYRPIFICPNSIKVTSSDIYGDFANPDVNVLINGSGMDSNDQHNNSFYDMCYIQDTTEANEKYDSEISQTGRVWLAFEFDRIYKLQKMLIWNYNQLAEYGMKDITIAYSTNKLGWTQKDYQLSAAPGSTTPADEQIVDLGTISAKYFVIIAKTNYQSGNQNKFGLSEIKFQYSTTNTNKANSPDPSSCATNPPLDIKLSWLSGTSLRIASHKIYISTDFYDVNDRTGSFISTDNPFYVPEGLIAGQEYYWAVDEADVNGNVVTGGKGDVWNFTVNSMEIRNWEVNGWTLGNVPMETIQVYGSGTSRCEAQVTRSNNGDLYAAISGTKLLFRSKDGGRTWSSKSLSSLLDDPNDGLPAFEIQKNGSFFTIHVPREAMDPSYGEANRVDHKLWVEINRSMDYGNTWSYISKIYTNTPPAQDTMVEGAMTLTRTYDGRLLYPVRRWKWDWNYASKGLPNYWYDRYSAQAVADGRALFELWYSDNNGLTWQNKSTFNFCMEGHTIQLHSGKLLAAFRYQRYWIPSGIPGFTPDTNESVTAAGGDYTYKYPDAENPLGRNVFNNVFVGESPDNGVTWQNLRPVRDKYGSALVQYGEAHGDLIQIPDGRVALIYEHRDPAWERQAIVRVSNDEGVTWETELYKVTMGNGYPSGMALEDGTIVGITGTSASSPYATYAFRWRLMPKKTGTPKANLKMVRKYAIVGREVLFDASDSNDTENNIVKYEWDFQGNNKFDYYETADNYLDGKFDGKTKYAYTSPGEYTARVRVTDSDGLNDTYNIYHIIVSEDLDGDDMPDEWERRHALDPCDSADASADSDGDGHNNLSEYLHQSNPFNDHSLPTPTIIFVPADIADYSQAQALSIPGDQIIANLLCDLNGDNKIDTIDFAMFAQNWMDTDCGWCNGADFTGDGNVNWEDLIWITEYWLAGN